MGIHSVAAPAAEETSSVPQKAVLQCVIWTQLAKLRARKQRPPSNAGALPIVVKYL